MSDEEKVKRYEVVEMGTLRPIYLRAGEGLTLERARIMAKRLRAATVREVRQ